MTSSITEREVAAELSAELNLIIQQGGTPFEKTSPEHHTDIRYPDITVWSAYPNDAFAFWELKAPGLQEDLSLLPGKASMVGARYVVVWNFQNGTLYEVESGKLIPRKYYPTPLLNSLEDWAVVHKRIAVVQQAEQILRDLSRLAQQQSLMPYVPDKLYFTSILQNAIDSLVPVLKDHIFQQKKNKRARDELDRWTVQQGYPTALPDLDQLLARHWAYSLAVRILFYFTVRRYYSGLPDLKPVAGSSLHIADLLQDAFSKAQAVDWQAVFEMSPLDRLGIPPQANPILQKLLEGFHQYDFGQLKEDVIGQIMEGLIPEDERHALGQYFTREDLIDFIIGFVASRDDAYYLDPTCGSGTFLNRLYSRMRWLSGYRATHSQLLDRVWGVDIAHFPAELATINLFRQNVKELANFPRIVVRDFFEVQPGETLNFPPLKTISLEHPKIQVKLPDFDGIVGNFPYIRQEIIDRQSKGYKQKITLSIARQWFWQDRELFQIKGIPDREIEQVRVSMPQFIEQWLQEQVQNGRIALRLSGQADIYAYLFYHAAAFLKEGGRLGIVTSNAWMDVAYGVELKRFFLRHFKIVAIVASWCEPWFEDAAINTAFTILERCEDAGERARNIVRFVKVKKPLADLLPRDLLMQEGERWQKVNALVREIESADAQITTWDSATGLVQPLQGIHTVESDDFRIRLVPQAELEQELAARGETAKWGAYIRAPQVYFDILEQAGDRLVPLEQVAEVRFGIKTGINDFFYLEPLEAGGRPGVLRVKNSRGWEGEIEEACLRPVIKSPKEARGLIVNPETLKYRLFLPPVDPEADDLFDELRAAYPLAYQYVLWGSLQHTPQGQPWRQVPSVQGRKAWWLLDQHDIADLLTMGFVNQRFFVLENLPRVYASDVMFEWQIRDQSYLTLIMALLNSTLTYFELEIIGRQNLGEGVLKIIGPELSTLKILNPNFIEEANKKKILGYYHKLKQRPVKSISEEVKQKDRKALDKAVLEALGLDPDRYLPQIYRGLVEMVQERLALPKLRASHKKSERRLSLEQVKQQVLSEILPGGLKRISAFLPARPEMMPVPLTGRPVAWNVFFTELTLLDADSKEAGKFQGNQEQARYAIYAAMPGQYMVDIPVDSVVASQAVQRYEQYLRQIAGEIHERVLQATNDYQQAERAVMEMLHSLGLPPLAISAATTG